jgi:hypothetical protein
MQTKGLHMKWRTAAAAMGVALWALFAALPHAPAQVTPNPPPAPNPAAPNLLMPNPATPNPGTPNPVPSYPAAPNLQAPDPDSPNLAKPSRETLNPAQPKLAWHAVLQGDVVVVELTDPTSFYRVDSVELIGPGGIQIPAPELRREVERSFATKAVEPSGPISLDVAGGSSSGVGVGIGLGGPIHSHNVDPKPKTVTHARIELPDPATYRADPSRWKLSAQLLSSEGGTSHAEYPAPAP